MSNSIVLLGNQSTFDSIESTWSRPSTRLNPNKFP